MHVSETSEDAGLKRSETEGPAFFSYSIISGTSPSHQQNIFGKPCLDVQPNCKRCLRASQPRGLEITHDKGQALCCAEVGASAAVEGLAGGLGGG